MDLASNIQNAASEDAIPNEPETQQEAAKVNASDTAPQDPTAAEDAAARSDGTSADPVTEQNANTPFLSFRYNHENRDLTRDEAINAAQIGLKYGEISEKLDRAAAIKGVSAVELLDSVISAERENYRNSLFERLGDDEETIDRLMKLYDIEQADKYEKALEDKKAQAEIKEHSLNERLANEFVSLKADFPEYAEYGNLPAEVRREAEKGTDLITALLLHKHREEKTAAAAKQAETAAAKATAGSLTGQSDNESNDIKEFKAGLWR